MTTWYAKVVGTGTQDGLSLANAKAGQAAITGAGTGDTVLFDNGTYQDMNVFSKTNVTFQALNAPDPVTPPGWSQPHPALATRHVIFQGVTFYKNSVDCIFDGIEFHFDKWCDTTLGQAWGPTRTGSTDIPPSDPATAWVFGAGSTLSSYGTTYGSGNIASFFLISNSGGASHGPEFDQCAFTWGYGPTQTAFDPTKNDYPEYQCGTWATDSHNSPGREDPYQSWWLRDDTNAAVVPNGRAYNSIILAPVALTVLAGSRPPAFYQCLFSDVSSAVENCNSLGNAIMDQCWLRRVYKDASSTAFAGSTPIDFNTAGLTMTRCVFEQMFGRSSDSFNPHADICQQFCNRTPEAEGRTYIPTLNFRVERNFMLVRPGWRASGQFAYMSGSGRSIFLNPIFRDNLTLQATGQVGLDLGGASVGGLTSGTVDGLFDHNEFINLPYDPQTGTLAINTYKSNRINFAGVQRTIGSIIGTSAGHPYANSTNEVAYGAGYASISFQNLLAGTDPGNTPPDNWPADAAALATWSATATTADWFNALKPRAPYDSSGLRYASIESFLLDPIDDSDIDPFVGFASATLCLRNVTQTSNPSFIRGPLGGSLTISVDVGEFMVDDWDGNVISDWGSADYTGLAVGYRLNLRHTTSSDYNTTVTQTATLSDATLGDFEFTFRSKTAADSAYPTVQFPNTSGGYFRYVGSLGVNTDKITFATWIRFMSAPGPSTYYVWGSTSGGGNPFRVRTLTSGGGLKVSIVGNLAAGGAAWTAYTSSNTATLDEDYLLIVSVDLSSGTLKAYGLNMTTAGNDLTWGAPSGVSVGGQLNFAASSTNGTVINTSAPDQKVDYIFLKLGGYLDPTLDSTQQLFSKQYIGPRGEGPFSGVPDYFFAGHASDWNTPSGFNLGTGVKLVSFSSGTIIDADSPLEPYPPILQLAATPQQPASVVQYEPFQILLTVEGTGVDVEVVGASDKAGTWDLTPYSLPTLTNGVIATFTPTASGTHTLTFTNDVSYLDPDPITLEVAGPVAPTSYTTAISTVGIVKGASVTFTVELDVPAVAPVNVTFAVDRAGAGTFTPSAVAAFDVGEQAKTLTYMPSVYGNFVFSTTNDGALPDPANLTLGVYFTTFATLVMIGARP